MWIAVIAVLCIIIFALKIHQDVEETVARELGEERQQLEQERQQLKNKKEKRIAGAIALSNEMQTNPRFLQLIGCMIKIIKEQNLEYIGFPNFNYCNKDYSKIILKCVDVKEDKWAPVHCGEKIYINLNDFNLELKNLEERIAFFYLVLQRCSNLAYNCGPGNTSRNIEDTIDEKGEWRTCAEQLLVLRRRIWDRKRTSTP